MKFKVNKKVIRLAVIYYLATFGFSLWFSPAKSQTLQEEINKQNAALATDAGYGTTNTPTTLILAARLINIFLSFVAIIFIVYTVYGGYLVMTAVGDADRITKAKSIIWYGVLGVIIILSARGIAWLVWDTWSRAQQNPFGSWFEWGVQPDTSGFYNKDPLQ